MKSRLTTLTIGTSLAAILAFNSPVSDAPARAGDVASPSSSQTNGGEINGPQFIYNVGESDDCSTLVVNGSSNVLSLGNSPAYEGRTTVSGNGVLDVGTISHNLLSPSSGLFLGHTNAASNIYGIIQGNGIFKRALNYPPGANQFSGAAGGFAARGGILTVNIGGAEAPIYLTQGGHQFGGNFVFGSPTADSKVILLNPIVLNAGTSSPRLFTVYAGAGGDSVELRGRLSDGKTNNGFAKQGNGLLILSATNTYTGPTEVRGGTLLVNGSLSTSSAVLVRQGATLGGTGTIGGPVSFIHPSASLLLTYGSPLTISGPIKVSDSVVHLKLPANVPIGNHTLATYNVNGSSGLFFPQPVIDSGSLAANAHAIIVTEGGSIVLQVKAVAAATLSQL